MSEIPQNKKSPANHLLDTIQELEELCADIKKNISLIALGDTLTSTQLKLFAEYRQLLKLRFDVLKRLAPLIEEAHFHRTVLSVLEVVSKETHDIVISALWKLDAEWNGEDDHDESSGGNDDEPPDDADKNE